MKYTLIHSFIHSFTYSLIHDLQETVDWDKKSLVDFNAGKTQLVLFDRSNNTSSIDVKINGSVPEEKSSFKIIFLKSSFKNHLPYAKVWNTVVISGLVPHKLQPLVATWNC